MRCVEKSTTRAPRVDFAAFNAEIDRHAAIARLGESEGVYACVAKRSSLSPRDKEGTRLRMRRRGRERAIEERQFEDLALWRVLRRRRVLQCDAAPPRRRRGTTRARRQRQRDRAAAAKHAGPRLENPDLFAFHKGAERCVPFSLSALQETADTAQHSPHLSDPSEQA